MSAGPFYAATPVAKSALLTTGDNSRTAPAHAATIFDPAGIGSGAGALQRLSVVPVATTVLSVIRLFRVVGGVYSLLFEITLPTQTVVAGTPVQIIEQSAVNFPGRFPVMVGVGETLAASVNDTQTGVEVTGQGGAG